MSEQNAQDTAEQLFDSETPEAATDAANDTTEDLEASNGEQEQVEPLDLEDKPSADDQRQKSIDAWKAKINAGASIDSLPVNLQWMKPYLTSETSTVKDDAEMDARIEQKFAKREVDQRFKDMKLSLQSAKLNKAERIAVQEEFQDLIKDGVPKDKALKKAIKYAGVDAETVQMLEKRKRMGLPHEGTVAVKSYDAGIVPGSPEWENLSAEERVKRLELRRTAGVSAGRYASKHK